MNREQAENLLDAYTDALIAVNEVKDCPECVWTAVGDLREVILAAMTMQTQPIITLPTTQPWTGKPIVTYTPYTVTCTGTDPAFNQTTGVDA